MGEGGVGWREDGEGGVGWREDGEEVHLCICTYSGMVSFHFMQRYVVILDQCDSKQQAHVLDKSIYVHTHGVVRLTENFDSKRSVLLNPSWGAFPRNSLVLPYCLTCIHTHTRLHQINYIRT